MKIKRLELAQFGAFETADITFSPGINVIIGKNSTGKSHLLKLLYAVVKVAGEGRMKEAVVLDPAPKGIETFSFELQKKLANVFRPDEGRLHRLVRRPEKHAHVRVEAASGASLSFNIRDNEPKTASTTPPATFDLTFGPPLTLPKCVFLPSRELLAMYEGFVGLYQERQISFDETYYDTCVALSLPTLRDPRVELLEPIEETLGGRITKKGDRFYVELEGGELEAHLVAEGLRKLATVAWLVKNGSLRDDSILFWDEPEANLNPHLVTLVVQLLQKMAERGVQVFFATHDYLLSQRLSLDKELNQSSVDLRFFSLHREKQDGPVEVETGGTLAEIEHNPILEEFARYYDDQVEWTRKYLAGKK